MTDGQPFGAARFRLQGMQGAFPATTGDGTFRARNAVPPRSLAKAHSGNSRPGCIVTSATAIMLRPCNSAPVHATQRRESLWKVNETIITLGCVKYLVVEARMAKQAKQAKKGGQDLGHLQEPSVDGQHAVLHGGIL